MKRVICLMLSICIFYPALAEEINCSSNATNAPNYNTFYGDSFGSWNQEMVHSMIYTVDDGQIFVGQTNSKGSGGTDAWIFKTDGKGQILWEKTIGGAQDDVLVDIVSTPDDGYMLVGTTWSKGNGQNDLWVVKVDGNGILQWNKTYGTGAMETGNAIIKNSQNEYVISGTKHNASFENKAQQLQLRQDHFVWMMKVDQNGTAIWDEKYHLDQMINVTDLHQTVDHGYVVSAITAYNDERKEDALVIKFDLNGLITWTSLLNGIVHAIEPLNDGTLQLAGTVHNPNNPSDTDGWLLKISPQGNTMWEKVMGSYGKDAFYDIADSGDGAMVIAGTYGADPQQDGNMWLVKIKNDGTLAYDETLQQQVPEQSPVMLSNRVQKEDYTTNMNNTQLNTERGEVYIVKAYNKVRFGKAPYPLEPLPFRPANSRDMVAKGLKPNP